MASEWFYESGGSQCGPVSSRELKSMAATGKIRPETLIWKEGCTDWIPAKETKGLFPDDLLVTLAAPPNPPPLTSSSTIRLVANSSGDDAEFAGLEQKSRQTQSHRAMTRLWLPCLGGFALMAFGVWGLLNSGPSATREGQSWSHTEMIQHLKGKGLKFEAKPTHRGGFWGPMMIFEFNGDEVYVQVRKSAQEAKDAASTGGERGFAWGRFIFAGEPKHLAEFKKALP